MHRLSPRGKPLLVTAALSALLVASAATAAYAGVWLPGQQPSEPVAAPVALDHMHRPSLRTLPVERLPAPPTPRPVAPAPAPTTADSSVWDRLAQCESGGRWNYNGSSGYDGGLQFLPSTWRAAGGTRYAPYAHQATRGQQIAVAKSWLARTSWAQWPACSRKLGLR